MFSYDFLGVTGIIFRCLRLVLFGDDVKASNSAIKEPYNRGIGCGCGAFVFSYAFAFGQAVTS